MHYDHTNMRQMQRIDSPDSNQLPILEALTLWAAKRRASIQPDHPAAAYVYDTRRDVYRLTFCDKHGIWCADLHAFHDGGRDLAGRIYWGQMITLHFSKGFGWVETFGHQLELGAELKNVLPELAATIIEKWRATPEYQAMRRSGMNEYLDRQAWADLVNPLFTLPLILPSSERAGLAGKRIETVELDDAPQIGLFGEVMI